MESFTEQKDHIIIIGAGAAGLMAARELSRNYKITVLEAQKAAGGRINTLYNTSFPRPVESGAEFIHGRLPVTLALLKEAGIKYHAIEGGMFQVVNGRWKEQHEMIEGWDDLLKHMGSIKEDMTMSVFLERYYGEEKYEALRKRVKNYVQGFDVADISRVSVKELYKEWNNEDENNFRTENGYGELIRFLESECDKQASAIYTGCVVKRIEWEKKKVVVSTEDGRIFKAQKVIITVPVSVLQNKHAAAAISFIPAIENYIAAAAGIGFGNVIKIVLLFKESFWEGRQKDIGFILSDEVIPTWWTQLPDRTPTLTGWLGGPPADLLNQESSERILELTLKSLSNIFQADLPFLRSMLAGSHITNWGSREFAFGAYSFSTTASAAAREKLNTPLADTLYFAGEALYEGTSPGTVEAALDSGKKVAEKIRHGE